MRTRQQFLAARAILTCTMTRPAAEKPRPYRELLLSAYEPFAFRLAVVLARRRVNPLWIVALHSLFGLLAAALITRSDSGSLPAAGLLLLLKTLLDNTDGAVARLSGRVTLAGRYFDTGMDFLVNAALFAALSTHMPAWLCLLAFLLLTLLLSANHNAARLYRLQREPAPQQQVEPGAPLILGWFRALYGLLLAPQDRLIEWIENQRFELLSGQSVSSAPLHCRLAWWDLFSTASLANLGLSTQLTLFAAALFLGKPGWYVNMVCLLALVTLLLQLVRSLRFRVFMQRSDCSASGDPEQNGGG